MTDFAFASAAELASLIRNREVSPVEVMRATLARIELSQATLNAFITVSAEPAMEAARAAEAAVMCGAPLGPLHGVRLAVKDLGCWCAPERTGQWRELTGSARVLCRITSYHHHLPGTQTQRRPFQCHRPRDQRQGWAPRGRRVGVSGRGGGIGGRPGEGPPGGGPPGGEPPGGGIGCPWATTGRAMIPSAARILRRCIIGLSSNKRRCIKQCRVAAVPTLGRFQGDCAGSEGAGAVE